MTCSPKISKDMNEEKRPFKSVRAHPAFRNISRVSLELNVRISLG